MESLTIAKIKVLKVLYTNYGMTNVWTSDGRIFYKNSSNKASLFESVVFLP